MKKSLLSRWFGHHDDDSATRVRLRDGLTVLVVDDSRTQLFSIEKILKAEGVKVYTAENGKQGILMARHVKPDLILMDIVMPEVNGFQATRYLSKQPETAGIPIVIVSGSDQESDKAWGMKLGARDYLHKPVSKSALLEMVSRWTSSSLGKEAAPRISTSATQGAPRVEVI